MSAQPIRFTCLTLLAFQIVITLCNPVDADFVLHAILLQSLSYRAGMRFQPIDRKGRKAFVHRSALIRTVAVPISR